MRLWVGFLSHSQLCNMLIINELCCIVPSVSFVHEVCMLLIFRKILSNGKLFLSLRPLCSVGIANLLSINHLNVQDGHTELQNCITQSG